MTPPNLLYYGDNLSVLREHVADASVDLVYLDPPFNSNVTCNVLFKAPDGEAAASHIEAFGDTWAWGTEAERAFEEVLRGGNSDAAELLRAMRAFLRENTMIEIGLELNYHKNSFLHNPCYFGINIRNRSKAPPTFTGSSG